jgi:hypothetical protein
VTQLKLAPPILLNSLANLGLVSRTQQSHAPEIAEMLLTAGCSADCLFESSLERKSFPEPVTPLLWLLRQESASTKCRTLVTALLKAGGKYIAL